MDGYSREEVFVWPVNLTGPNAAGVRIEIADIVGSREADYLELEISSNKDIEVAGRGPFKIAGGRPLGKTEAGFTADPRVDFESGDSGVAQRDVLARSFPISGSADGYKHKCKTPVQTGDYIAVNTTSANLPTDVNIILRVGYR